MSRTAPEIRATARQRRNRPVPAAATLWALLRPLNRQLGLHLRRQAPIGPLIADLAEFRLRVAVLILPAQSAPDMRAGWLRARGFHTLVLTDAAILASPDAAAQRVLDALLAAGASAENPAGARGPRLPSPLRGGDGGGGCNAPADPNRRPR